MKERTRKMSLNDCIRKFHDVTIVTAYEHEDVRYYDSAYRYLMELKELRSSIKKLIRILKSYESITERSHDVSEYRMGADAGARHIGSMVRAYLEREEEENNNDTV